MSAVSDFLENTLLDLVFNGVPYTSPVQVYVALYTTPTTDGGGGTEVSTGSYARQAVSFALAANGQVQTDADIVFPAATGSWGTITHVALRDALAGGNSLWHGPLVAPRPIATGDTFKFNAGDLLASLD